MSANTSERDALFALLRSHGTLKRAYVPLRQALPDVLRRSADAHALVLSAVESLLDGEPAWPGSSAPGYCSLLLDGAGKMEAQPSVQSLAQSAAICERHPSFFRKLMAVYGSGSVVRDAALAAARALVARGEHGEVCSLIAEHDLSEAFDVRAVMRAALDQNKPHAAASLGASRRDLALELLDEYCGRGDARQAMRLMPRLRLTRGAVPLALRRQLRLGVLAPKLHWLARSRHWDLIDVAFASLAIAAASAPEHVPTSDAPHPAAIEPFDAADDTDAPLDDIAAVESMVQSAPLLRAEWVGLAGLLTERLIGLGLRPAAVQACVRHRLDTHLAAALGSPLTEEERVAACAASEDDVACGVFSGPLALPPSQAESSQAESSQAEPSRAEPRQVKSTQVVSAPLAPSGSAVVSLGEGDDDGDREPLHAVSGGGSAAELVATELPPPGAQGYLALDLPLTHVLVVADGAGLDRMCAHVLGATGTLGTSARVLGIDVEWCDHDLIDVSASDPSAVQWVQLATGLRIFLLDIPALTTAAWAPALRDALHRVLAAPHVLKVGYGLKQDLSRLRKEHPALAPCAPELVRPAIELGQLWKLANGRAKQVPGLAALVAETLGLPLDKSMRMSNWKRRPLVSAQRVYAALDSHCLVRIYAAWERQRLDARAKPPLAEMVPPAHACGTGRCLARVKASADARRPCISPRSPVTIELAVGVSFAAGLL